MSSGCRWRRGRCESTSSSTLDTISRRVSGAKANIDGVCALPGRGSHNNVSLSLSPAHTHELNKVIFRFTPENYNWLTDKGGLGRTKVARGAGTRRRIQARTS